MIFAGAVLAGGESRRMGRPKAFIEIAGEPMITRVVRALEDGGAEPVVVVGGDAPRLRALDLTVVPDRHPGEGPLGGIITALHASGDAAAVAVLACDLVAPSAAEIARLVAALETADVVVPVVEQREQWTHAVWARSALPALETAFAAGERAPRRAAQTLTVCREAVEAGSADAYADADAPEDLPS